MNPTDPARLTPAAGADGILVCSLPASPEQGEAFARWAQADALRERPDLVVVVPEQIHSLREAATELRALHWLRESTPELRDDRVARSRGGRTPLTPGDPAGHGRRAAA